MLFYRKKVFLDRVFTPTTICCFAASHLQFATSIFSILNFYTQLCSKILTISRLHLVVDANGYSVLITLPLIERARDGGLSLTLDNAFAFARTGASLLRIPCTATGVYTISVV